MAQTAGQLVDRARTLGGLDVDRDEVLAWFNERYSTMVSRSRAIKKRVSVGTTDGGGSYVAPADVVEVYELYVDGQEYLKVRRRGMLAARRGQLRVSYPGLVYSSEADDDGAATFEVYPAPVVGLEVEAFAAVRPEALGYDDVPVVPTGYHRGIVQGIMATGLELDTEQIGAADRHEARFDAACEELRQEVRRQFRGSGPRQILVAGING